MSFIELTTKKTGRTLYVRAECIAYFFDYINDDEGEQYTHVVMTGEEETFLAVVESPEEILRRIKDLPP